MSKNVLALGPYIGSFEQEILTFRPYMRWIELNSEARHVFYSSHFNRQFLYPQVSNKKYFSVYKQLTRQEIHQSGYSHKDVKQRDFMSLIRLYKDNVTSTIKCIKKDIDQQSLPYVKYIAPISIYHKVFDPIKVPKVRRKGNIVFIPDHRMPIEVAMEIFDYLNGNGHKFSVIGDMKCHLPESNEVLREVDYLITGYKKIIAAITNSTCVITPCSHWTAIANLQGAPVFSWGTALGQYRKEGIYNFDNENARVIYHGDDTRTKILLSQIGSFLKEIV